MHEPHQKSKRVKWKKKFDQHQNHEKKFWLLRHLWSQTRTIIVTNKILFKS